MGCLNGQEPSLVSWMSSFRCLEIKHSHNTQDVNTSSVFHEDIISYSISIRHEQDNMTNVQTEVQSNKVLFLK